MSCLAFADSMKSSQSDDDPASSCRNGQWQAVHHVLNECPVDRGAAMTFPEHAEDSEKPKHFTCHRSNDQRQAVHHVLNECLVDRGTSLTFAATLMNIRIKRLLVTSVLIAATASGRRCITC